MDKTQSRLRRAKQTRVKIAELQVARLAVHRTNTHIYAQSVLAVRHQGAGKRVDAGS